VLADHQDWLVVTLEPEPFELVEPLVLEPLELVLEPLVLDPFELAEESSSEDVALLDESSEDVVLLDVSSEEAVVLDAVVLVSPLVCCAALLVDVLPR
jgi:hypothetical protein